MKNLPGFLTVNDVATILNVDPNVIIKQCEEGELEAWRVDDKTSAWQIAIKSFLTHPNAQQIFERYEKRNEAMSKFIAENEELKRQFEEAQKRRNDPSFYSSDIELFNRLVDGGHE